MKFEKSKDTKDLFHRTVLNMDSNSIEMGIYPVMFGFRVRIGFVGKSYCQLDLCGGDNLEMINLLYNGSRQIIEGQLRLNGKIDFNEFPEQVKKPFYKGMEFLKVFCDLIIKYREHEEVDVNNIPITREDLEAARFHQKSLNF